MKWQELVIDGYGRILKMLERSLKGLTPQDLNEQPHPDCNSMGWLAWHLNRLLDEEIARLAGEEQLWVKEGWHAKFDRPADPKDIGFGHTSAEVAAFQSPAVNTFLQYHRAALAQLERYVNTLSAADLDRELDEPWFQPLPTVGVRLVSVMCDGLQHVGQIAYLRGLLKGKGWLGV